MPGYKGHLVGGTVAWAAGAYALRSCCGLWITPGEWLLFTLAGALFPDIDVKSKGQHYFYWLLVMLLIFLCIQERFALVAGVSILAMVPMLVRHRGIFHKLWFILLLTIIIWLFIASMIPLCARIAAFDLFFFAIGAISHLWLDLGVRRMLRW